MMVQHQPLDIPQNTPLEKESKKTITDMLLCGAVNGVDNLGFIINVCVHKNKRVDVDHALGQMVINAMATALQNRDEVRCLHSRAHI